MDTLLHIIESYGLWVVFFCVLLDQGGLPFPSYAPMIVTAALATDKHESLWPVLLVATAAALIADLAWFAGGRRFGTQLLRLMCRVSLSPDSCVGMTRNIYSRWGAPSLILAKYIPGFAAVSTTLAGESGIGVRRFIIFDGIGAALWVGGAVALGAIFHEAVEAVLIQLDQLGQLALLLLIAAIVLFVLFKWWQRQSFMSQIRMSRISIDELATLLDSGSTATILDVRSPERRAASGWIPGSVSVRDISELQLAPGEEVIVYCDCPNDASAAVVARKLKERGYKRVRPLAGGLEAWQARGRPVLRPAASEQ
ncbi:VTT domain-containing protein [Steroidobacter sp. S1-65]|uniref:VTT domain-containing protein n=1 Tax=Steroidobacter gossypii TaxID=2805490 RepID=A0ABS1X3E2_9GAMM|nr:rhodanese-like domain-containing protein [Steroidobacter gossypii]MBM0107749.1 VTT domain-containing protein [Steroidobacter gossypii]